jgi:hypothetical protein
MVARATVAGIPLISHTERVFPCFHESASTQGGYEAYIRNDKVARSLDTVDFNARFLSRRWNLAR